MKTKRLLATMCAIGALITMTSCGSREGGPEESLVGVWLTGEYIYKEFKRFNEDGSFETFNHQVSGKPYSKGEWEIRDDGFFYWRATVILHEDEYKQVTHIDGEDVWDKLSLAFSEGGDRVTLTRHQDDRNMKYTDSTFTWQRAEDPSR